MTVSYDDIVRALAPHGLIARGGFRPETGDGLPESTIVAVMVGNVGPDLWRVFAADRRDEPDAMDRWTRRTLDAIAGRVGASARYPFEGPPWLPFQRWARRCEAVHPSPIGMSIHPEHGLWHAYRGVLAFRTEVSGAPARSDAANPCESCADRPCLAACPVGAFAPGAYDVPVCANHLRSAEGADCMALGCRARRACPVGRHDTYLPEQAAFHMEAFLASR